MTGAQQGTGDLARQMLRQQIAAVRQRGPVAAVQPTKRRRARFNDGRDPIGLGDAITQLTADRAWEMPVAGANVIEQWPQIAPELAGRVVAERWDAERRCLHLRPSSPAYGTQLRLLAPQLVARINAKAVGVQVASIRVLPPGADGAGEPASVPGPRQPTPAEARTAAPVKTVEDGCAGYQGVRAIILAAKQEREEHAAARDRHFAAHRNWLREPEDAFTDAVEMVSDLTAKAAASEDVHRRALAAARAQKAGGPVPGVIRLADTA